MKSNLSDNIRIIRQKKGYSQEYIAYRLKISQQAYSLIENKAEKTTLEKLLKISKILEIKIESLINENYKINIQKKEYESLPYHKDLSDIIDQKLENEKINSILNNNIKSNKELNHLILKLNKLILLLKNISKKKMI